MLSRLGPSVRAAAFSLAAVASLASLGLLSSCGKTVTADPESISVVVKVPAVPSDAAKLKILATLNGTDAMQPLTLTDRNGFSRFGVRLPLDKSGSLALKIDVIDANDCMLGSASANTPIGPPVQTEISATLTLLGQRLCPPPAQPMTCTPDLFCPSKVTGVTQDIRSLFGFAPKDIWAVGTLGLIMHYDGTSWSQVAPATSMADPAMNLNSVWGAAANDVWIVGDGNIILRYDGRNWTRRGSTVAGAKDVTSVWGSNQVLVYYTVSNTDPTKVHFAEVVQGNDFSFLTITVPAGITLESLWGASDDNIWTVGNQAIFNVTKSGTTRNFTQFITSAALRSVWGAAANDIWAVGDAGQLWHWNGSNFTAQAAPTSMHLRSVWGSSANDVWAVGAGGTVIHYDGSTWTAGQSGTPVDLNAVWGLNNIDVWTAGAAGNILHSLK
jgi:hypothetical protein